MYTQSFRITNITCEACIKLSTQSLQALPHVSSVSIEATTGKTLVQSTEPVLWEEIVKELAEVGKTVEQTA